MFSDPIKNLNYLSLSPGMVVADFGVGSGFYSLAASRGVGSGGKVYAIDVQKDLLDRLQQSAIREHVSNIETLWGNIEERGGVKLADNMVDAVIVANVLFQVDSQYGVALEAKRILKPGGKVMVVDWQDSYGGIGPQSEQVIPVDKVVEIFTEAGFEKENEFSAGAHHYGIIFKINKK